MMFMNRHNVDHDAHDHASKYHDAEQVTVSVSHIHDFRRGTANAQYSQSQPHADAILFGRG